MQHHVFVCLLECLIPHYRKCNCWHFICFSVNQVNHKAHAPYLWILGSLGVCLVLIVLVVIIFVCLRSSSCFTESRGRSKNDPDESISHKFHILQTTNFCCASGRNIFCKSKDAKQTNGESSDRKMNIPKGWFYT